MLIMCNVVDVDDVDEVDEVDTVYIYRPDKIISLYKPQRFSQVCLSVCRSVCQLSVCLSVCLFVRLFVRMSVCLSLCPSIVRLLLNVGCLLIPSPFILPLSPSTRLIYLSASSPFFERY